MNINSINALVPSLDGDLSARGLKSGYGPEAVANMPQIADTIGTSHAKSPSFGQMLSNAIAEVNQSQLHAGDMTTRLAAGEALDVHQVMIASQEAGVALNLALQVRNKLVDAYTEVMHVNV